MQVDGLFQNGCNMPRDDVYKYDPEYHRFADYMGVDIHKRKDLKIANKLSLLFDWAKKSKRGLLLFIDEADAFLCE